MSITKDPLFVPDELTPATKEDLIVSLVHSWDRFHGQEPTIDKLACCLAQVALETGHMTACHCWNIGNIKRRRGAGHSWTMFPCGEFTGGTHRMFYPPHAQTHFMAFDDLDDGLQYYIGFLARSDRYRHAWIAVHEGDPESFAAELGEAGYYTAPIKHYTEIVVRLFEQYRLLAREIVEPELISDLDRQRIDGLIDISLDQIVRGLLNGPAELPQPYALPIS